MRWKSTLVLFAAAISIGAYISLVELKRPTPQESKRQSSYALHIEPETVTQITLDLPKAKTTLTRHGNLWTLAPNGVRADAGMVNQVLTVASALSAKRVLAPSPEKPLSLKEFGLDPATGSISVTANGAISTLMVGGLSPVGSTQYVKRTDRPDIFIVDADFYKVLDKPLESLRDHTLIHLSSWLCKTIQLKSPGASWRVVNEGSVWKMAEPIADKTDAQTVTQYISQVERISIRKFIADSSSADQFSAWGFNTPKAELIIQAGDPAVTTSLLFGKALPEDSALVYAKRSDEPAIYAVAASEAEELMKDANSLRVKKLFNFFTAKVTKIAVAWSGKTWAVVKDAENKWPAAGAEDFLNTLAEAQAAGFIDANPNDLNQYGLNSPVGTLSVYTSGSTEAQELMIGSEVPQSKERYGRIKARDTILILPEALITLLAQATPEKLALPAAPPAAPD